MNLPGLNRLRSGDRLLKQRRKRHFSVCGSCVAMPLDCGNPVQRLMRLVHSSICQVVSPAAIPAFDGNHGGIKRDLPKTYLISRKYRWPTSQRISSALNFHILAIFRLTQWFQCLAHSLSKWQNRNIFLRTRPVQICRQCPSPPAAQVPHAESIACARQMGAQNSWHHQTNGRRP